jgi:hypothetical protein
MDASIADDLVIEDLAAENAALRERAALADAYRWEALEAIERLGEKMRELETAHRINADLRERLSIARTRVAA